MEELVKQWSKIDKEWESNKCIRRGVYNKNLTNVCEDYNDVIIDKTSTDISNWFSSGILFRNSNNLNKSELAWEVDHNQAEELEIVDTVNSLFWESYGSVSRLPRLQNQLTISSRFKELDSYSKLEDGWFGEDSYSIPNSIILNIKSFLLRLISDMSEKEYSFKSLEFQPVSNGTITLDISVSHSYYFNISFGEEKANFVYLNKPSEPVLLSIDYKNLQDEDLNTIKFLFKSILDVLEA